jgi:SAM-dependent methyltransferase
MASIEPDIVAYYDRGKEQERLGDRDTGRLEFSRTQIILRAALPAPPADVLDVGGAAGVHAEWLALDGYRVELIDPMPLHVEQARECAASQPEAPFTAELGDARDLSRADASADAVLLLGPLYHLPDASERALALSEAARVVRPGGVVIAAGISRFASTLDGVLRDFMLDPQFRDISRSDLQHGVHRNPDRTPGYFTTAYFHHPDELRGELVAVGLHDVEVRAVEGFGGLLGDLDERLDNPARAEALRESLAVVDREPSMLGVSFHLLGIGRRAVG